MKLEETITVSVHMKALKSTEDVGRKLNKEIEQGD